jgi:hypothetical protein
MLGIIGLSVFGIFIERGKIGDKPKQSSISINKFKFL